MLDNKKCIQRRGKKKAASSGYYLKYFFFNRTMTTLYLLLLILQVFSCTNVEQVSALIPGKCYLLLVFNGMGRFLYNWTFLLKARVEMKND